MPSVRILIVDDNNDFAELLSNYLSAISGFEIVGIAADGLCAINMIYEHNPDVVLLDIVMPQADGLDVLRHIRNVGRKSPFVLIISALGVNELYQQAQALGANGYFLKPVQMDSIVETIQDVFEKNVSLEEKVTKLLHKIKITPYILGFRYLRDLIVLYITDSEKDITSLAHIVADSYNVKYEIFLSTIRYAIKVAWDQDEGKNTASFFYNYKKEHLKRPTVHKFVQLAASKLASHCPY